MLNEASMIAIDRATKALVAMALVATPASYATAQTPPPPLPDVNVTAPKPNATPNWVPREVPPTEQNSYFGRNRVEEDMFAERPCSETRMSSSAGGKCLEGYKLTGGYVSSSDPCHIQLDVVSAATAAYTFEADTFVFDPYLVNSSGPIPKGCHVGKEAAYDLARLQDMNSMTRRGANWRNYIDNEDDGSRSAEYSDGRLNCVALRRLGPNWRGGVIWSVHAAICRLDGAPVQPADVHAMLSSIKIRVYDPVGNLRPASQSIEYVSVE
jgi:hypothetical protein